MELVLQYLNKHDKMQVLSTVISIWDEQGVKGTPEMASRIEQMGIDASSSYVAMANLRNTGRKPSAQDLASIILSYIIRYIDRQDFDQLKEFITEDKYLEVEY